MTSQLHIGPYRAHTRLGVGGMAEVWLASRTGPQAFVKDYVVKRILPHLATDQKFVELFLNEARLAARVSHANVAQVFELGEDAGNFYIVMEHVDGRSLRDLLREFRRHGLRLPVAVALYIAARAAEGLHHAHETRGEGGTPLGIVHRDVSPENIILSYDGQVKLVDFGVARATGAAESIQASTLSGKLPYMAPEQATGGVIDRRVDIYALGVTLYEMLAGRRPFASDNPKDLLRAILGDAPQPIARYRDDVREPVETLIAHALAKTPELRIAQARELGARLDAALRDEAQVSAVDLAAIMERTFPRQPAPLRRPTAPTTPHVQNVRATRRWPVVAGAIAVGLMVGVGVALMRGETEPDVLVTQAPAPAPPEPSAPGPAVAPPQAAAPGPQGAAPPPKARPRPLEKARLDVRVRPWGDVIVDDTAVGATPIEPLEVTPGRHRVVAVNAELKRRKVVNVVARPGKSTVVEIDLTN